MSFRICPLFITFGLLILISACTTISPGINQPFVMQPVIFSHRSFDGVLNKAVNQQGLVNYQFLKAQADELDAYFHLISRYSPDSHPELFKTAQDQLAYWINAYNASVIRIVLNYYPINSIEDVKPPFPWFFLSDKTGFFFFQRPSFGGISTSLYYLENSVIRERFAEPRVHFALNCASRGCPRLPNYAFTGDQLDQQLEHEARRFFSEQRNLKIDLARKILYLSAIMDWYRDDFVDWYQARYPGQEASLIKYVALYLPKEQAAQLKANLTDFSIEFFPYDWALNDQKQAK